MFALALLQWTGRGQTQSVTDRKVRIGFLNPGFPSAPGSDNAFVRGMGELGYAIGRNLVVEYRFAEGRLDRLAGLAAELVRLPVDVLVVAGPSPLQAARAATKTIPIVMLGGSSDPVGEGVALSLARPSGNITGLTFAVSPERFGKQLELLKEAAPRVSRVAVWWDQPMALFHQSWAAPLRTAGQRLGLEVLDPIQVLDAASVDGAFVTMRRQRADALLVAIAGPTNRYRKRVAEAAVENRLPTIAAMKEFAGDGGLLSYGPDFPEMYRRGATFVDKILRGVKPGDLPIELPSKYELAVNLKTAAALGLSIPQSLLLRADQVIQ